MTSHAIDTRRLAQFLAVLDAGGMRAAARRIHVAQPALSRTVAELEAELGVTLFERVGRRMAPTADGLRVAEDARVVLAELDGLVARARTLAGGGRGRLRVGSSPSATFHPLVPELLRTFRAEHPGVELELLELGSTELVEAVAGRTLDVAFVRRAVHETSGVDALALADERLVALVPRLHALASARSLTMARVLAEPLLLPPPRSGASLLHVVEDAARALGRPLRIAATASHVASLVHLAEVGMGIALVPASVASMRPRGMRAVPVTSRARLPLRLVHRPSPRLPAVRALVALARVAARDVDGPTRHGVRYAAPR